MKDGEGDLGLGGVLTFAAVRLDLVDFADAAAEWGLVVLLPAAEAERIVALAEGRGVVELGEMV